MSRDVDLIPEKTILRPNRHIPALDGLRGIAVLLVVAYHLGGGAASHNNLLRAMGTANKAGWIGVTLFFLLSGFLITGILWDSKGQPHWWRNFYVRRALRILPLYYGSLVLLLVIAACNGTFNTAAANIWVLFLYLQNVPPISSLVANIPPPLFLDHYWTLAVEEQFYLLWPLLISLAKTRKHAAIFCLSTFCFSLFFRIVATHNVLPVDTLFLLLPTRAGELALGGFLAIAYRSVGWTKLQAWLTPLALTGFAVFVGTTYRNGFALTNATALTTGLTALTISFAALIALSLGEGYVKRICSLSLLRWFGKISFGLYVFHLLFLNIFAAVAAKVAGTDHETRFLVVRMLIAGFGSIFLAWSSFTYYETPILKLRAFFAAKRETAPPSTNHS